MTVEHGTGLTDQLPDPPAMPKLIESRNANYIRLGERAQSTDY